LLSTPAAPTITVLPSTRSFSRRASATRLPTVDLDPPTYPVIATLALVTIFILVTAFFAACGLRGYLRYRQRAIEEAAYARTMFGVDGFDFPA
jgi:hypothetical protein